MRLVNSIIDQCSTHDDRLLVKPGGVYNQFESDKFSDYSDVINAGEFYQPIISIATTSVRVVHISPL